MNRSCPKLLVATEFPPNALGGGPAVVRQMLKGWPAERLVWWSCLPDQQSCEFKVESHRIAYIPKKLYPHERLLRPKVWILHHLWSRWATRHLRVTVARHQPDVIWAIPHQWSILPLAKVLPTGRPGYHISVHDYPAHHLEQKIGLKMTNRLDLLLDHLYQKAASRDAICQEMATDLKQRTGRSAEEIFNSGVEPEDFAYLEQKRPRNGATIKIAHAGTITAETTFVQLVQSLERVRKKLSRGVEMHLFGAHVYRDKSWFRAEWMIEHGNASEERLRMELRQCDWGVSPMELTSENPRYNRFSLPSKTVKYLAAGLPIIVLGHRDSTVIHLARRYSFGVNIEDNDPEIMEDLLLQRLGERDIWARYRDEILRCARSEFDATRMRTRLHKALAAEVT